MELFSLKALVFKRSPFLILLTNSHKKKKKRAGRLEVSLKDTQTRWRLHSLNGWMKFWQQLEKRKFISRMKLLKDAGQIFYGSINRSPLNRGNNLVNGRFRRWWKLWWMDPELLLFCETKTGSCWEPIPFSILYFTPTVLSPKKTLTFFSQLKK